MPLDRTLAPAFQPIRDINFIEPESFVLGNGLTAWLIRSGDQEVIRIEWISRSGRWYEPRPGISYFGIKMLGEGAGELSSEALSEAFQQYGAFLELTNGFDFSTIAVYTLTRHLEPILDLMQLMLSVPTFDEKELESLKNIKIQEIRLNQKKNNITASQLFRKCLFGKEHPYGKELDEQLAEEVSQNELRNYFTNHLLNESELILSGKFTDQHVQLIDQKLGNIQFPKLSRDPQFEIDPVPLLQKEIEGSLQTSIRYGKRFLGREDPDYIPMMFVNEILGGYFGSRLMKNIREDKGFTYGIYSSMVTLKEDAYLVIGTDVKKENATQTLDEIRKEIDILKNNPVGTEELETVRNYMLGSLISSMDTAFDLADKFKSVHLKGHSMAYYQTLVQTIQTMDSLTIKNLANKHLDIDTFTLVTVG